MNITKNRDLFLKSDQAGSQKFVGLEESGFQLTRPEHIAADRRSITNLNDGRATYPCNTQDYFSFVQANFENVSKKGSDSSESASKGCIDDEKAKQTVMKSAPFEYKERDVILYAFGLGAKRTYLLPFHDLQDEISKK